MRRGDAEGIPAIIEKAESSGVLVPIGICLWRKKGVGKQESTCMEEFEGFWNCASKFFAAKCLGLGFRVLGFRVSGSKFFAAKCLG